MNLDRLKIFHAVATFQSFTRASEKLFLTQPGISKHIKLLEEFYGTRLFDRLGKKIALTHAGEILYEVTKDIFLLLDKAKASIDDIEGLATGVLKVGASFTIGIYILPQFFAQFRNQFPNISVSLDISLSRNIANKVRRNRLDMGLVGAPPKDEKLISTRVLMDELVVIIPHDHKWSNRKKIYPKELMEQPFILSKDGSGTRQTIIDRLKNYGVILKNYLEFGNTEAVKKAVECGLGISILSKYVVFREVEAGLLKAIPLSEIDLMREIFLIYHKDKYLTNLMRSFIDLFTVVQNCEMDLRS